MNSPKKVGIWGTGIVGQSAIKYFSNKPEYKIIAIANKTEPEKNFLELLETKDIKFYLESEIINFLETCDLILPSPGIDLKKYYIYKNKFITEADIFYKNWDSQKPIISITGTIGKTSVVSLLSKVLEQNGLKVATGGNIGTGMLDLLENQENFDIAVLELSSFQLEYINSFAPDLAIITNIFENHLDRHENLEKYKQAKFNSFQSFIRQKESHKVLLPLELRPDIQHIQNLYNSTDLSFFTEKIPNNLINTEQEVFSLSTQFNHPIPDISYPINWVIIFAACEKISEVLKNKSNKIFKLNILNIEQLEIPDHRVELVREFNGIEFYDDSKSTVCQATLAAVEKLKDKPLILFLGGLSKGVNRADLVKNLKNKVNKIICFGGESQELYKFCLENSIESSCHENLQDSFNEALNSAKAGYRILFSPAGSSFDLFKDYKDRGNRFKQLVQNLK